MHAGDGSVHTNLPVYFDGYCMLQWANQAEARIRRLANVYTLRHIDPGAISQGTGVQKSRRGDRGHQAPGQSQGVDIVPFLFARIDTLRG